MTRDDGVNILGRVGAPLGTAAAGRMVIDALMARGVPLSVFHWDGELGGRQNENVQHYPLVEAVSALPFRHTILLDSSVSLERIFDRIAVIADRFTYSTVMYWELDRFPASWESTIEKLEPVLAPSQFVQSAIEHTYNRAAPLIPVTPTFDFSRLQPRKNDGTFRFLVHFDLLSSFARKNPYCALDAFVHAFGDRRDVELVVKLWQYAEALVDTTALTERYAEQRNIRWITGDLPYVEVMQLVNDCDVYVSTHRAEGLGLGLLEAMACGKPLIATNYGGCRDFLNPSVGFPIAYDLIPVESPQHFYQPASLGGQAYWAEPDLNDVAHAMLRLSGDSALYARCATEAKAQFTRRRNDFLGLEWLKALPINFTPNENPAHEEKPIKNITSDTTQSPKRTLRDLTPRH